ncbi:hypothetical protein Corgl_1728 [Coriobacterium glomerans PW2]|uniref:GIY-YIG domain-containing protein n=1 Tax=Coriobacterium glomerans (strain ATCC 49209 / DSM 20642 / JCM 10262 / PW2) TaxID=700015 RepID=F2NB73_CORGP|nr:GIY-YIG nuclease family protein [Coriobacterium glomerans]AEB07824.1 hypothetical protein Corgl_1728 [Coriobacterium glomerans PW2]
MPVRFPPSDLAALSDLIPLILVFFLAAAIALRAVRLLSPSSLKRTMRRGSPIAAEEFLRDWITSKSGGRASAGYKTLDRPGCYVILTNPKRWSLRRRAHDNVYVGQSLRVCTRVRQHLTGHGNGNVFADVRNGDRVFVRIFCCRHSRLNELERRLIARYHAIESYNDTLGGSARR